MTALTTHGTLHNKAQVRSSLQSSRSQSQAELCMQWLAQPDVSARLAREAAAAQQPGYSIVEAAEAAAVDLQCTAPVHPELTPLDYCRSLLSSKLPQLAHQEGTRENLQMLLNISHICLHNAL